MNKAQKIEIFWLLNTCGAGEEIRTPDLRITNALLYQLSYTGAICLFTLAQELRTAKRRRSMPEDYLFSKSET